MAAHQQHTGSQPAFSHIRHAASGPGAHVLHGHATHPGSTLVHPILFMQCGATALFISVECAGASVGPHMRLLRPEAHKTERRLGVRTPQCVQDEVRLRQQAAGVLVVQYQFDTGCQPAGEDHPSGRHPLHTLMLLRLHHCLQGGWHRIQLHLRPPLHAAHPPSREGPYHSRPRRRTALRDVRTAWDGPAD